jgi:predicted outer membrane repeat protein
MVLVMLSIASTIPTHATIYVVNPQGTGNFPTIQAAIDAVSTGDTIDLLDGTYVGDGNHDVDFRAKAVTLRSQSGNPSSCIIDCQGSPDEAHRGFLFVSGEGSTSVIEAVTVRNGVIPPGGDPPNGCGAAILCLDSSPTLRDCTFIESSALLGGAMYCANSSSPQIADCTFIGNHAALGGAFFCSSSCQPTLSGCMFLENTATSDAGALDCHDGSDATIVNCTFIANTAPMGGAIQCISSSPLVRGCTFYANAGSLCGGVYSHTSSSPTLENVIVAFCPEGPAVLCSEGSSAWLSCCDLFGNAGGDWAGFIADQYGTSGNIALDPLFCDAPGNDLTLEAVSPCAPAYNPVCGLIGAWPVACGGTPTSPVTWGALKNVFRR